MSGFKNFLLRGNLVEAAVAFIMGVSFAKVVETFTAWLTSLLPGFELKAGEDPSEMTTFINAVIAFVIMAAVVYFLVVVPYTKAKERFFPSEPGVDEVSLLTEIRDSLRARN
jgi:large conductance mechanosensitive channel